jgi:hypothetical protein
MADLTMGVEIEFILLQNRTKNPDQGNPELGPQMVHNVISRPLRATCATCGEKHDFQLGLNHLDLRGTDYSKWTVTEDISIMINEWREEYPQHFQKENPHLYPWKMEVVSRTIRPNALVPTTISLTDPSHRHSISYEEEITAVLSAINTAFRTCEPDTAFLSLTSQDCGLHVHVGNHNKSFPVGTVQNVLDIYLANERAIDALQSVDRITGSTILTERRPDFVDRRRFIPLRLPDQPPSHVIYNAPWTETMAVARAEHLARCRDASSPIANPSIPSWQTFISQKQTIQDLQDLQLGGGKRSTINLENLSPYNPTGYPVRSHTGALDTKKNTIEFRQHAGTLNAREILSWMTLLHRLVTVAHTKPPAELKTHLLATAYDQPAHHALDFLHHTLEMPRTHRAFKFYKRLLGLYACPAQHPSYAHSLSEKSRDLARLFEAQPDFPHERAFHDILLLDAERKFEVKNVRAVRARVQEKFVAGGYGRFERTFLEGLVGAGNDINDVFTAEERRSLIVGAEVEGESSTGSTDEDSDDTWTAEDGERSIVKPGEKILPVEGAESSIIKPGEKTLPVEGAERSTANAGEVGEEASTAEKGEH